MIPLYLGFLHFALLLPASPSLPAACCVPAEHWDPLRQWLTPPVEPCCSHQASPGCLSGPARVAQDVFVFGRSFPGSNLGVEGFRRMVEASSGEVGTPLTLSPSTGSSVPPQPPLARG